MLRTLVSLAILAALAWVAVWFTDHPGWVTIRWRDYEVATSFAVLVVVVAGIAVVVAVVYHGWRWLKGGPRRYLARRAIERRERGYRALTDGLVAVAAGDPKKAQEFGRKAGHLIDNPFNLLLLAQTAQLRGDEAAAKRTFRAMLDHPETRFLGLRGLLVQATKAGDWKAALEYAREAYALRPDTEWAAEALFDLEARAGDWLGAQRTLEAASRHKLIGGTEGARRRAVVLAERGRAAEADGRRDEAATLYQEAHRLAPELAFAAARAAALATNEGRPRAAARIVERAWRAGPHPDLAVAYLAIHADEPAIARLKRIERLAALTPGDAEADLAYAEAALAAELWGTARQHLETVLAARPSRRAFRLMATLEEHEHGDGEAVRRWLERAASAPPDPAWICRECAAVAAEWHGTCPACGAFDALEWKAPPAPRALAPAEAPAAIEAPRDAG